MTHEIRNIFVGALVVLVGAVFLVHFSRGGVREVEGDIGLSAIYQNVDGVAPGTDVMLAGIKIGKVTGLEYVANGHRAMVSMRVRSDIGLPTDSVAMIVSTGMLGGKYIKLAPGGETQVMKDGDQFEYVQGAVIFEELLQKVVLDAEARRKTQAAGAKPEATPESKPNPFGSLLK